MKNTKIVSDYLKELNLYPTNKEVTDLGIQISVSRNKELFINASAEDLIELADLLTSLATSKSGSGKHFHIDDLTLIDDKSQITDVIIEKR